MLSMTQSTNILANVYQVDQKRLQRTRKALSDMGALPANVGRDLPEASPDRVALLILGASINDPERICKLADLRSFTKDPRDQADPKTLCNVLAFSLMGLFNNPMQGLDMNLTVTLTGTPWASITNSDNQALMSFGEFRANSTYVMNYSVISLLPLMDYVTLSNRAKPPFRKSA